MGYLIGLLLVLGNCDGRKNVHLVYQMNDTFCLKFVGILKDDIILYLMNYFFSFSGE